VPRPEPWSELNQSAALQRSPSKRKKSRIGSDPLATRFDRQRCQPRILHQVSVSVRSSAQCREDFPVARSGLNDLAMWLLQEHCCEGQGIRKATGAHEYPRVGDEPDHRRASPVSGLLSSIKWSRAALSFRSIPGSTPPPASETGSPTGSQWRLTLILICLEISLRRLHVILLHARTVH
jgi:hypothetical protein